MITLQHLKRNKIQCAILLLLGVLQSSQQQECDTTCKLQCGLLYGHSCQEYLNKCGTACILEPSQQDFFNCQQLCQKEFSEKQVDCSQTCLVFDPTYEGALDKGIMGQSASSQQNQQNDYKSSQQSGDLNGTSLIQESVNSTESQEFTIFDSSTLQEGSGLDSNSHQADQTTSTQQISESLTKESSLLVNTSSKISGNAIELHDLTISLPKVESIDNETVKATTILEITSPKVQTNNETVITKEERIIETTIPLTIGKVHEHSTSQTQVVTRIETTSTEIHQSLNSSDSSETLIETHSVEVHKPKATSTNTTLTEITLQNGNILEEILIEKPFAEKLDHSIVTTERILIDIPNVETQNKLVSHSEEKIIHNVQPLKNLSQSVSIIETHIVEKQQSTNGQGEITVTRDELSVQGDVQASDYEMIEEVLQSFNLSRSDFKDILQESHEVSSSSDSTHTTITRDSYRPLSSNTTHTTITTTESRVISGSSQIAPTIDVTIPQTHTKDGQQIQTTVIDVVIPDQQGATIKQQIIETSTPVSGQTTTTKTTTTTTTTTTTSSSDGQTRQETVILQKDPQVKVVNETQVIATTEFQLIKPQQVTETEIIEINEIHKHQTVMPIKESERKQTTESSETITTEVHRPKSDQSQSTTTIQTNKTEVHTPSQDFQTCIESQKVESVCYKNETVYEFSQPKVEIVNNTIISVTTVQVIKQKINLKDESVEIIETKTIEIRTPFRIEQVINISDQFNSVSVTQTIDALAPSIIGIEAVKAKCALDIQTQVNIGKPKITFGQAEVISESVVSIKKPATACFNQTIGTEVVCYENKTVSVSNITTVNETVIKEEVIIVPTVTTTTNKTIVEETITISKPSINITNETITTIEQIDIQKPTIEHINETITIHETIKKETIEPIIEEFKSNQTIEILETVVTEVIIPKEFVNVTETVIETKITEVTQAAVVREEHIITETQVTVKPVQVTTKNETIVSQTVVEVIKPTVETVNETIDFVETKTITFEQPKANHTTEVSREIIETKIVETHKPKITKFIETQQNVTETIIEITKTETIDHPNKTVETIEILIPHVDEKNVTTTTVETVVIAQPKVEIFEDKQIITETVNITKPTVTTHNETIQITETQIIQVVEPLIQEEVIQQQIIVNETHIVERHTPLDVQNKSVVVIETIVTETTKPAETKEVIVEQIHTEHIVTVKPTVEQRNETITTTTVIEHTMPTIVQEETIVQVTDTKTVSFEIPTNVTFQNFTTVTETIETKHVEIESKPFIQEEIILEEIIVQPKQEMIKETIKEIIVTETKEPIQVDIKQFEQKEVIETIEITHTQVNQTEFHNVTETVIIHKPQIKVEDEVIIVQEIVDVVKPNITTETEQIQITEEQIIEVIQPVHKVNETIITTKDIIKETIIPIQTTEQFNHSKTIIETTETHIISQPVVIEEKIVEQKQIHVTPSIEVRNQTIIQETTVEVIQPTIQTEQVRVDINETIVVDQYIPLVEKLITEQEVVEQKQQIIETTVTKTVEVIQPVHVEEVTKTNKTIIEKVITQVVGIEEAREKIIEIEDVPSSVQTINITETSKEQIIISQPDVKVVNESYVLKEEIQIIRPTVETQEKIIEVTEIEKVEIIQPIGKLNETITIIEDKKVEIIKPVVESQEIIIQETTVTNVTRPIVHEEIVIQESEEIIIEETIIQEKRVEVVPTIERVNETIVSSTVIDVVQPTIVEKERIIDVHETIVVNFTQPLDITKSEEFTEVIDTQIIETIKPVITTNQTHVSETTINVTRHEVKQIVHEQIIQETVEKKEVVVESFQIHQKPVIDTSVIVQNETIVTEEIIVLQPTIHQREETIVVEEGIKIIKEEVKEQNQTIHVEEQIIIQQIIPVDVQNKTIVTNKTTVEEIIITPIHVNETIVEQKITVTEVKKPMIVEEIVIQEEDQIILEEKITVHPTEFKQINETTIESITIIEDIKPTVVEQNRTINIVETTTVDIIKTTPVDIHQEVILQETLIKNHTEIITPIVTQDEKTVTETIIQTITTEHKKPQVSETHIVEQIEIIVPSVTTHNQTLTNVTEKIIIFEPEVTETKEEIIITEEVQIIQPTVETKEEIIQTIETHITTVVEPKHVVNQTTTVVETIIEEIVISQDTKEVILDKIYNETVVTKPKVKEIIVELKEESVIVHEPTIETKNETVTTSTVIEIIKETVQTSNQTIDIKETTVVNITKPLDVEVTNKTVEIIETKVVEVHKPTIVEEQVVEHIFETTTIETKQPVINQTTHIVEEFEIFVEHAEQEPKHEKIIIFEPTVTVNETTVKVTEEVQIIQEPKVTEEHTIEVTEVTMTTIEQPIVQQQIIVNQTITTVETTTTEVHHHENVTDTTVHETKVTKVTEPVVHEHTVIEHTEKIEQVITEPEVHIVPTVERVNDTIVSSTTIEVIQPTIVQEEKTIDVVESKTINITKTIEQTENITEVIQTKVHEVIKPTVVNETTTTTTTIDVTITETKTPVVNQTSHIVETLEIIVPSITVGDKVVENVTETVIIREPTIEVTEETFKIVSDVQVIQPAIETKNQTIEVSESIIVEVTEQRTEQPATEIHQTVVKTDIVKEVITHHVTEEQTIKETKVIETTSPVLNRTVDTIVHEQMIMIDEPIYDIKPTTIKLDQQEHVVQSSTTIELVQPIQEQKEEFIQITETKTVNITEPIIEQKHEITTTEEQLVIEDKGYEKIIETVETKTQEKHIPIIAENATTFTETIIEVTTTETKKPQIKVSETTEDVIIESIKIINEAKLIETVNIHKPQILQTNETITVEEITEIVKPSVHEQNFTVDSVETITVDVVQPILKEQVVENEQIVTQEITIVDKIKQTITPDETTEKVVIEEQIIVDVHQTQPVTTEEIFIQKVIEETGPKIVVQDDQELIVEKETITQEISQDQIIQSNTTTTKTISTETLETKVTSFRPPTKNIMKMNAKVEEQLVIEEESTFDEILIDEPQVQEEIQTKPEIKVEETVVEEQIVEQPKVFENTTTTKIVTQETKLTSVRPPTKNIMKMNAKVEEQRKVEEELIFNEIFIDEPQVQSNQTTTTTTEEIVIEDFFESTPQFYEETVVEEKIVEKQTQHKVIIQDFQVQEIEKKVEEKLQELHITTVPQVQNTTVIEETVTVIQTQNQTVQEETQYQVAQELPMMELKEEQIIIQKEEEVVVEQNATTTETTLEIKKDVIITEEQPIHFEDETQVVDIRTQITNITTTKTSQSGPKLVKVDNKQFVIHRIKPEEFHQEETILEVSEEIIIDSTVDIKDLINQSEMRVFNHTVIEPTQQIETADETILRDTTQSTVTITRRESEQEVSKVVVQHTVQQNQYTQTEQTVLQKEEQEVILQQTLTNTLLEAPTFSTTTTRTVTSEQTISNGPTIETKESYEVQVPQVAEQQIVQQTTVVAEEQPHTHDEWQAEGYVLTEEEKKHQIMFEAFKKKLQSEFQQEIEFSYDVDQNIDYLEEWNSNQYDFIIAQDSMHSIQSTIKFYNYIKLYGDLMTEEQYQLSVQGSLLPVVLNPLYINVTETKSIIKHQLKLLSSLIAQGRTKYMNSNFLSRVMNQYVERVTVVSADEVAQTTKISKYANEQQHTDEATFLINALSQNRSALKDAQSQFYTNYGDAIAQQQGESVYSENGLKLNNEQQHKVIEALHQIILRAGVGKEQFEIKTDNVTMSVHTIDSKALDQPYFIGLFQQGGFLPKQLVLADISLALNQQDLDHDHSKMGVTIYQSQQFNGDKIMASSVAYHKDSHAEDCPCENHAHNSTVLSDIISVQIFRVLNESAQGEAEIQKIQNTTLSPPIQINFGDLSTKGLPSPSKRKLECGYLDPVSNQWKQNGMKLVYDSEDVHSKVLRNAKCEISELNTAVLFSVLSCEQKPDIGSSSLYVQVLITLAVIAVICGVLLCIYIKRCQTTEEEFQESPMNPKGSLTDLEKPLLSGEEDTLRTRSSYRTNFLHNGKISSDYRQLV